jgi:long-chain acyl-CoA synthetase
VYARSTESERHITYGELARGCRRVAEVLARHGATAGETVSVVMPNGLQTLRLLLGAMHGGYCVNPVNLLSQPEQMRYVLAHSDCRVVCVAPEWEARVREMVQAFDRPVTVIVVDPEAEALPGETDAPADAPPPRPPKPSRC